MKRRFRIFAIPRLTAINVFPGGCPIFMPLGLLQQTIKPGPEPMVTTARQEGKTAAAEIYKFGTAAEARAFSEERLQPNTTFAEREKIITAMCYTSRHDYGLVAGAGELGTGMTTDQRTALRNEMAQLFDHHIEPIIKKRDQARQEQKITEMMLNRARGFSVDMPMVTTFDDKPLDWWRELRLQAHSDAEQLKLIAAALRRAGIEEKKDTPPHATVSLLASRYLRLMEGKVPEGMVAMDRERMEQLLEIERGHQASKDDARTAEAALERAHFDLNEFAKEYGYKTTATAEGSRRELLGEIAGHLLGLESEVEHLRKKLQEATKPVYGESPMLKLVPIYQALTKITDQLDLTVVNAYANAPELLVQAICEEIQRLQKGQMQGEYMEAQQQSTQWQQAYERSCDDVAHLKNERQDLLRRLAATLDVEVEDSNDKIVAAVAVDRAIGETNQDKAEKLMQKVQTLRTIVQRKAPHTGDCMADPHPVNAKCGCWKAEFMQVTNDASFSDTSQTLPDLGAPFGGGLFAGEMEVAGDRYALVVAPKIEGEKMGMPWQEGTQFCRDLQIGGHSDWYVPSRDELAMLYRNLGPRKESTPEAFKEGSAESFEPRWYWSSTEHASYSYYAWVVLFNSGNQSGYGKYSNFGVRAVRRLKI